MDKYVILVFLLAPGFIARNISIIVGDFPTKKTEFESVINYFSYSFFSLMLSFMIALGLGMFEFDDSILVVLEKISKMTIALKFSLIALLSGLVIGVGWTIFLKRFILRNYNKYANQLGCSEVFLESSLLDRVFSDGEKHLVTVSKAGKEIATVL